MNIYRDLWGKEGALRVIIEAASLAGQVQPSSEVVVWSKALTEIQVSIEEGIAACGHLEAAHVLIMSTLRHQIEGPSYIAESSGSDCGSRSLDHLDPLVVLNG